jgi:diadenosine tetraphosphate (Ap4A) HIT family hydrolase
MSDVAKLYNKTAYDNSGIFKYSSGWLVLVPNKAAKEILNDTDLEYAYTVEILARLAQQKR